MQGVNQSWPLTVDRILDHAAAWRGAGEVVTPSSEGGMARATYVQLARRAHRLAAALAARGLTRGARGMVIGANSTRQLEAWYAIIGAGGVCHPLNQDIRPDALLSLLNQGGDVVLFIDAGLLPTLAPVLTQAGALKLVVTMADNGRVPEVSLPGVVDHDALIAQAGEGPWGGLEETDPAALAHSVGSAGPGAGVIWSHRACVLAGMIGMGPDGLNLSARESVLALTPLWRAGAWGLVFSAPMAGAKLVLPGPRTDAQSIRILADREQATLAVGSPAELLELHAQFRAESRRPSSLKRVIAVGAPCPPALVKAWRGDFGIDVQSAWGLTETIAVGSVFDPADGVMRAPFGLDLDAAGGRLTARGATVAGDGPLDTGDLGTVDSEGRLSLLGRAGDALTIDGRRASAQALEDAAAAHPATAECAAIDPPAGMDADGPVLVVQRRAGATAGKPEYLRFLQGRVDEALVPAEVLFVDLLPHDAAGRLDRRVLRDQLQRLHAPDLVPPRVEQVQPAPPIPQMQPLPMALAAAALTASPAIYEAPADVAIQSGPDSRIETFDETPPPPAEAEADEPAPPADFTTPAELQLAETELHIDSVPPGEDLQSVDLPSAEDDEPARFDESEAEPAQAATALPPPIARITDPLVMTADELSPFASAPLREKRTAKQAPGIVRLFLTFTTILALIPPVMIIAAALAIRYDLLDWRVGLGELIIDWPFKIALLGLLGGVLGLFAGLIGGVRLVWRRVLISLLLPVLVMLGYVSIKTATDRYPPLHDVATDWVDPIQFSAALITTRGPEAAPVDADPFIPTSAVAYMNRRVADVNAETCPAARPAVVTLSPAQAYARVKAAVLADGMQMFIDNPEGGRLEATATGVWLGFKDDLAVRIRPSGAGSRIDMRSSSRNAVSTDLGSNCQRISRLIAAVQGG